MFWLLNYRFALIFFLVFLFVSLILKKKQITFPKPVSFMLELFCVGAGCLTRGFINRGMRIAMLTFVFAVFYFNTKDADAISSYLFIFGILTIYSAIRSTNFDPEKEADKKKYGRGSYSSSVSSDFDERSFMEHHHHSDDDYRSPF